MPSVTLGIGGLLGHDANAALFVDGALVRAAQEERFTRVKHDGAFPSHAIADALDAAGLVHDDVDTVVFAEKPVQTRLFNATDRAGGLVARLLGQLLPERAAGHYAAAARAVFPRACFRFAWHHLAHVAGAYHTSSFKRAAFLCVDGKGEDYCASLGVVDGRELRIFREQPYGNGLGMLYTLVTHALGFLSFGSEYKVMGLAPYGRAVFTGKLRALCHDGPGGGLRLRRAVRWRWGEMMAALPWIAEVVGVPVRGKGEALRREHLDLAASLQAVFEEEVFAMARVAREMTGERQLLFTGGCAQNCVAAGRLRALGIFDEISNSPVGGDMGSALGAALLHERERRGEDFRLDASGFYLGSDPGPAPAAAREHCVEYAGDLHAFIAGEIAAGKVVGWVRGRMELGARALGARSILADPRPLEMQSTLNLKVKFRESFRPFAPAILAEHAGEWFDSSAESDYMNYTANLLPKRRVAVPGGFDGIREQLAFHRCEIPSVVHVDFSARLQTVRREVHPDFHRLITEFHRITGVPIVINTSFNVSGQPIVRTAAEAWECFLNTDMDLLVLNDEVFRQPAGRTRAEKLAWLAQFSAAA